MSFDLETTDRLLSTTRAVRKRLDLERPVEPEVIERCLELAVQAPTGSNRQDWHFVVVTDADKRARLADLYRRGSLEYLDSAVEMAESAGDGENLRVFRSARYLVDILPRVPVHVIPCVKGPLDASLPANRIAGITGSIFPAVWSFQLALRSRGLGSVLTTLHLKYADEAAALLAIPADRVQMALLPVAYTKGTDFKPAGRQPLSEVVSWNSFGRARRDGENRDA